MKILTELRQRNPLSSPCHLAMMLAAAAAIPYAEALKMVQG
jgi:hypothetical protein